MATARTARHLRVREAAPEYTSSAASRPAVSVAALPERSGQVRPVLVPMRKSRKAPLVVRINRGLRTLLVAMCGLALLGYGLDVAASNDVGKLQEQARRLSEQNTELSAQLLRVISFQGIQDSVLGRCGLRVPEQVLIVKEVPPIPLGSFEPQKHHLPLIAGY